MVIHYLKQVVIVNFIWQTSIVNLLLNQLIYDHYYFHEQKRLFFLNKDNMPVQNTIRKFKNIWFSNFSGIPIFIRDIKDGFYKEVLKR